MSRRLMRPLFAVCLVVVRAVVAQAPPEVVDKVVAESAKNSQVMAHLDHLTNAIGPRLTGSERLTQAVEWARDAFKSFGIDNARLEQWGTIAVGFDRGTHQGLMRVGEAATPVAFGTNAWTPGTDGMKEGPAILGPTDEEGLAAFRETAGGAWVVRPPKCSVSKEINDISIEKGALGIVANGGDLVLTSGNHKTKWDDLPKLVRINVHKPDYESIVETLKARKDVKLAFDVQNRFKQGPVAVYNVLADIIGSEKPDEIVVVGGHIDSWDGATGTTDNGTGVATTLEAARLLMKAGAQPRRTIRFMLWSGEEEGLLGSRAWIEKHLDQMEKISAVLVHDGGTNYVSGIHATQEMLPAIKRAMEPVIVSLGQKLEDSVEESDSSGGGPFGEGRRAGASRPAADESMKFKIRVVRALPVGIGSDHDSFLLHGVPGFFWRQAGRANYTHTHHTQYDTFDAAIAEYETHSSKVIALGALGVANLDEKLPRQQVSGGRSGRAPGRRLGIQLGDDGLLIDEVVDGGRAQMAGIKAGDRIVKIDDSAVKNRGEMSDALNLGTPTKTVTFVRDKKELQVTIDFTESRPVDSRPVDSRPVPESRPTGPR